ncbi:MAG TPA: M3 family oligoendopeptidase [Anaerolineales bacterium]|nr:M3 family oligoendopeptidase [Anaerolineales bacterium]
MEQVERPIKWTLHDLLPKPGGRRGLKKAFSKLEQALAELEATRELLSDTIAPEDFNLVLAKLESFTLLKNRLEAYAELSFAEDTNDPAALNLRDRVDQLLTDAGNRTLFLEMWFKDLPPTTIQKLIENSGDNHYFVESMTRFNPYLLTEAEERLINLKDVNGIDALVNLYEMITSQFTFNLEVDGKLESLTLDQVTGYFSSVSPEMREKSYREMYRVFIENSTVLAQMYIHRVRDWTTEGLELRGFASPIAIQNVDNDLPDGVVDTLLDVCRKNAPLFQRYFMMKARWLGLEKLRRYDIYAPLAASDKKYEFHVAKQMVMDSFRAFSPEVAALAQRVFEENHLDSQIRPGKRGGAFCFTATPDLTPWVMMNYDNSARDIATLAHELGHAIHSMLAGHHSVLTQQPALPLAETASVFAEMQLTDCLLGQENDPAVRRELLASALDDAYVTVMRQAYFTIFERDAHAMINDDCTMDELKEHYLENLREQFGDAVDVPDEFQWEWIVIPHLYHSPFYTYAYSFGQLLVLSLYRQYQSEGQSFIPRYLKILSYGGSESPMKILAEAGLEVASPAFWQGGFDVLRTMIDELEQAT